MWRTQVSRDFPSEWYNLSWRRPNTQESTDKQNRRQDGRNEGTAFPKQKSLSMKLLVCWRFHMGLFTAFWKIIWTSARLPHVSPLNELIPSEDNLRVMRYGFTGQHGKSFKVHALNSGAISRLTVCSPGLTTLKGTHWLEGKWCCSREINSAH